jgi:hypothetical protein
LDPEDGHFTVLGPTEEGAITAFTHYGVDNLVEPIRMVKTNPPQTLKLRKRQL